jgi:hypothetical protein
MSVFWWFFYFFIVIIILFTLIVFFLKVKERMHRKNRQVIYYPQNNQQNSFPQVYVVPSTNSTHLFNSRDNHYVRNPQFLHQPQLQTSYIQPSAPVLESN